MAEEKRLRITLEAARVNAGFTQKMAAEKANISEYTLSNYERGRTSPGAKTLAKLLKIYQVSYDDIIFLNSDYGLTEQ